MKTVRIFIEPKKIQLSDRRLLILEYLLNNGPIEGYLIPVVTEIKDDKRLKEDIGLLISEGYIVENGEYLQLAYPGAWRKYQILYFRELKWYATTLIAAAGLCTAIVGLFL